MTVDDASIYGLLGPSGCGKTTLLRCILGLQQLDSGEISIFGHPSGSKQLDIPGRTVGYMSQEIALYTRFTIGETLNFFGKLYGVNEETVRVRLRHLSALFSLPKAGRIVGTLSGGQKRRVSLAVALLHEPRLLILDEPTVGVDAVLRKRIWNYLRVLCDEGKTIIITTHYIDEAVRADKIGLIGDGRLLSEDNPENLLRLHNAANIDDVFVTLSRQSYPENWTSANDEVTLPAAPEITWQQRGSGFRSILWKSVSHLMRSPLETMCYYLIPLITVTGLYWTIGNPPRHLPVALVDGECDGINVTCPEVCLSCAFIGELDDAMIRLIPYENVTAATEAARNGDVWGIVAIPANFSKHLEARFRNGVRSSSEDLSGSQIQLTFDMTIQQMTLFVFEMVTEAFQTFTKQYAIAKGYTPDVVSLPIKVHSLEDGKKPATDYEFIIIAFIILIVSLTIQAQSSSAYITEKRDGVLDRLWISGLSTETLFLTNIAVQYVIMAVICIITLAVAILGCGLPVRGSLFWLFMLYMLHGSISIAIGNILSIFINNHILMIEIYILIYFLCMTTGGSVWPVETLDPYTYALSISVPYTLPVISSRNILLQGWDPWHPEVWPGFAVILVWDVLLFAALFAAVTTIRNDWIMRKYIEWRRNKQEVLREDELEVLVRERDNNVNSTVTVDGGWKSYFVSQEPVLSGITMTVPEASIYGLLGASGCGKTTLLNCILGLSGLDAGNISIFGKSLGSKDLEIPGRTVGYMSQDIALYNHFTIRETLRFFGNIYGMSTKSIQERSDFLSRLFSLPPGNRRVGTLSGGEKRRVSLAVALLHEPRLIILDEPTVGVDSFIRNSIWKYLRKLCQEGKTVIITTHYIEEAVTADKVGLMADGQLLAEDSPSKLLDRFHVSTLEEVFVKVSKRQNEEADEFTQRENVHQDLSSKLPRGFRAILWKNVVNIIRSPAEVFFFFVVPVSIVIMLYICIGNPPRHLPFAVVNYERLDSPVCEPHSHCAPIDLSCNFLSEIDQDVLDLVAFDSESAAVDAMKHGGMQGALMFPANFSNDLERRLNKGIRADPDEIRGSQIQMIIDMTSRQLMLLVYQMLVDSFSKFSEALVKACKLPVEASAFPLVIGEPIYGSKSLTFREFILPSFLLMSCCALIQLYSSSTYVKERHDGVLDRLWTAGLSTRTIFFANALVHHVLMLLIFSLSLSVAVLGFGFDVRGSFAWLYVLILIQGSGAVAIGNLLAICIKNETLVVLLIICMFLSSVIFSGIVWPLESLDQYSYAVTMIFPYTLPLISWRHIVTHGWNPWHPKVWPGFAVAICWDIVLYAAIYFLSGRVKRKHVS